MILFALDNLLFIYFCLKILSMKPVISDSAILTITAGPKPDIVAPSVILKAITITAPFTTK